MEGEYLRERLKIWWELVRPSWDWILVAPITILGVAGAIRDEVIAPAPPEVYKLVYWLPDWRWQTYLLIVTIVLVAFILESAYRAIRKRNVQIAGFKNQYSHALALEKLIPSLDWGNKNNKFEIRLLLKNGADGPLKYIVESYRYSIENASVETGRRPAITLTKGASSTFFPSGGFPGQKYDGFKDRTEGALSCSIVYGHPDTGMSRRMTTTMHIDLFKQGDQAVLNWRILLHDDIEL